MSYTSVFGGTTIYPSDVSLLAIMLNADKALEWPLESNDPSNPAARIIDVTTTGSYAITLPDATQTGAGQTILFNNLPASSNSFLLKDAGGSTIATVGVGEQWQVYLSGTATVAGTWRVFRYGASTATVQASALAGYGLTVTSNTLSQSLPVTTFNSGPRTVLLTDRASALVWNGTGAGVLNLPTAASAGNNFFIGVRNSGGGDLTVDASGSELVDGAPSLALRPGDSANLLTDGLQWYTLGLGQEAVFAFDYTSIAVNGGTYTLAGSELNRIVYKFVGTLTSDQYIVVPSTVQQYWVDNATNGAFSFFLRTSGGTPIGVAQGTRGIYYCDGSNMVDADTSTVSLPVSATDGGTGITSYTVGDLLYANSTTSLARLADVAVGNALISGGVGVVPSWGKIGLTTHVSGTLPVANGGTGATTSTGSGAVVLATSPTLVTPSLGTPSAATLTNATGLPIVAGTTGTLSVARGGTGATASTGSGNVVLATSPTLVTPTLGAASATSLSNGLGAVGTPSYTFTGDTNTGIFSPAADTLAFVEGGVEVMRIDSAGNLGIGTTSVGYKLDVPNNVVHFLETVVGNDALGWGRFVTASSTFFIQSGSLNSGLSASRDFAFTNMYGTGEILRLLASGGITSANLADAVGYKGLPQNSRTASYTLALSDMGKHISITTGGVVIPDNGTLSFPIGATVVIYNNSSSTQTISILPTDTLRLAGTASTGTRTLAQRGLATCVKVEAGTWVVSGNVT